MKTPMLKQSILNRPITVDKSRAWALALLAGVVALFSLGFVAPLLGLAREYRESAEDLRFRLQRLQRIASEKDDLVRRLEKLKAEGQHDENFLEKNTAALASADLQTRIKEAVSAAGGELTSTQVIPERQVEGFTRIAVKVRMNGSTPVLRDVLHQFESDQPFLFIENLNIRPIRIPRRRTAAEQPQVPDRLSVDFEVVGYMRG